MAKKYPVRPIRGEKEWLKEFEMLSRRHDASRAFSDFCEMSAIAFSNACDKHQRDRREARYLMVINSYHELEDRLRFPALLSGLVEIAEKEGYGDHLGHLFEQLQLSNDRKGQFFTPYEVSRFMARMTFDAAQAIVDREGWISVSEPCSGAGGMIVAAAEALKHQGIDYQKRMHVTAMDIDPRCVWMTYIQCTLFHIPAIVQCGDTIRLTLDETWYSLAHVVGGWTQKIQAKQALDQARRLMLDPPGTPGSDVIEAPRQAAA